MFLLAKSDIWGMKNKMETVLVAAELVGKDFEIALEEHFPEKQEISYEALFALLERQIRYLLEKNPERLMQAFYRIDVSEEKVKRVLAFGEGESVSRELTRLVLERELQKAEFRRKYSPKR